MTNKPNILILGATGKVGADIVNQLVDNKDVNIIATTRSSKKVQTFKDKGIESRILDLDDPKTIAPALENIDRALLLTGYTVDMLRQSKRFLDTAKQSGVKHIVHIGASTAPTNEVAHWGLNSGLGTSWIVKRSTLPNPVNTAAFIVDITNLLVFIE